ncbi:NYN domain-containing protein [bacterium]|nr:NYN domain-containing protein [bacterium]
MVTVVVDGYNLIRRTESLRVIENASGLEAARLALETALAGYVAARKDVLVTVVYDSAPGPRESQSGGPRGVRAVFSPDADSTVVELALEAAVKGRQVRAVSSDWAGVVSQLAGNNRVEVLGADAFWREVTPERVERSAKKSGGSVKPAVGRSEKPTHISRSEVDYWLEAFGSKGEEEE